MNDTQLLISITVKALIITGIIFFVPLFLAFKNEKNNKTKGR